MKTKNIHFTHTLYFLIFGVFGGGFTAILLLGIQNGIQFLINDCISSWEFYIGLTWILSITLPLIKYYRLTDQSNISNGQIWLFNLFEFIFLQGALTAFWTSGNTFCYVGDGQNGFEFILTAFLSLPILLGINFMFDLKIKTKPNNI